ncbi:hypothetical protein SAMN05444401_0419 [Clostridium amylolyticum]|uniref:Uncharacterized protein n=1 Tax=Clostridium amylolyticum TaxID=1121298 RepID=A0A1M6P525_9CLOT|nr:DUF6241 domain-containing protein [Clostridium amylolyticum]SHK03065.1 hypothetical protein SAMN05444401_0419 [Clostridium amylolyticum]
MKEYIKWGVISLIIITFVGGITFFTWRLFFYKNNVEKIEDNPTTEQKVIIDQEFETKETIAVEELVDKVSIYTMMHEMANTKIVAEDGMIWGLQPMTKDRIIAVRTALKKNDPSHKRLFEILDRWENKDFTQGVEDHNYLWKLLDGNVGKAVRLR